MSSWSLTWTWTRIQKCIDTLCQALRCYWGLLTLWRAKVAKAHCQWANSHNLHFILKSYYVSLQVEGILWNMCIYAILHNRNGNTRHGSAEGPLMSRRVFDQNSQTSNIILRNFFFLITGAATTGTGLLPSGQGLDTYGTAIKSITSNLSLQRPKSLLPKWMHSRTNHTTAEANLAAFAASPWTGINQQQWWKWGSTGTNKNYH